MTGFVPSRDRDNLNSFAHAVWGNAQIVLKRDHTTEVDYIDLTGYFGAFEFLLGPAVRHHAKILVRDEYRIALHELETSDTYCDGAYITGQPGIGKTLFLAYILVKHLGQRRAVAWQDTGGSQFYVLLSDTATFYSLSDSTPLYEYGPLWALSDSNAAVQSPAPIFYHSRHVRTIQTTSPKQSRWKEWSKQAGAECFVMDIWSEKEIANLAKLLNFDVARMTTLAKEWGGVPRSLLRFVRQRLTDAQIESTYTVPASKAVQKCRELLSAIEGNTLSDDALSQIYFCRPRNNAEPSMQRRLVGASVPTRTLRRLLGEALQVQGNFVKLDFFHALRQPALTRRAAGYIYENWFHTYFSAGKPIECHWIHGLNGVSSLSFTGMKLIDTNWGAVGVEDPPYYWVAPMNFPGVDGALILADAIYAFQVTIGARHKSPKDGMKILRAYLPANLKNLASRVVFVGDNDSAIKAVANKWVNEGLAIGWSHVDPVVENIIYRAFRDESDPVVDDVSMEVSE